MSKDKPKPIPPAIDGRDIGVRRVDVGADGNIHVAVKLSRYNSLLLNWYRQDRKLTLDMQIPSRTIRLLTCTVELFENFQREGEVKIK